MADDNEVKEVQEPEKEQKQEDKKDKQDNKQDKKANKHDKANTVFFPEGASEADIERHQKELKKQYKVGRPTIMQILTAVLSGLVILGIVIAVVVIAVTES